MRTEYKFLLSFIGIGFIVYIMNRTLNITIKREILTDKRTIGKMYINGKYFCDTLEDTYRGQDLKDIKVQDQTAIPNGVYDIALTWSTKFVKMLPQILNVPFFTGIRVHTGSSEKDTSGCILVGDYSNGVWSANPDYVYKLKELLPLYAKATINITTV